MSKTRLEGVVDPPGFKTLLINMVSSPRRSGVLSLTFSTGRGRISFFEGYPIFSFAIFDKKYTGVKALLKIIERGLKENVTFDFIVDEIGVMKNLLDLWDDVLSRRNKNRIGYKLSWIKNPDLLLEFVINNFETGFMFLHARNIDYLMLFKNKPIITLSKIGDLIKIVFPFNLRHIDPNCWIDYDALPSELLSNIIPIKPGGIEDYLLEI